MTDQDIIQALIERDERVTQQFFFKSCRPLFTSIIRHVFSYEVDYDEFVSEFYLYLMENDAHRLRQFEGRSTIYQWLKITAIRYFIAKRKRLVNMEASNEKQQEALMQKEKVDSEQAMTAQMDIDHLFELMKNKRYTHVIRRLVLEEAEPKTVAQELGTNVDNLYNIKKRAITALTEIALKEAKRHEKSIHI